MGRTLRFQRHAKQDLAAIHRYTATEWSPEQAERYLAGLHEAFERLAAFPQLGQAWRSGSHSRISLHQSHRILYRPIPGGIEIGRVLHQAQRFAKELEWYEGAIQAEE